MKQLYLPKFFKTFFTSKIALLINCILFAFAANAQTTSISEPCGSSHLHQQMMQNNANYASKVLANEQRLIKYKNSTHLNKSTSSQTRVVPVVFHVMNDGTPLTQISKDEIKKAIKELNERFRKIAGSEGDGNGVDIGIEFALAVRDPNGNCTDGINYWDISGNANFTNYVNNGVSSANGNLGVPDVTFKNLARWNPTQYYNIWVVGKINGPVDVVAGYALLADGAHGIDADGTVIQAKYVKFGITLTHELGHAFNLYHTFEGDGNGGQCPTNVDCETDGDRVCDTPPHKRSSNCNAGTNSCTGSSNAAHIHNYMDYSGGSCQNEFTAGQKARMLFAIDSIRKSFLASEGNMSLVPPAVADADFITPTTVACAGTNLKFYDKSTCTPNTFLDTEFPGISFSWTVKKNGNTVHTSTKQNLSYTFIDTGKYTINFQVTNTNGTDTKTSNLLITNPSIVAVCQPDSYNPPNNYDATLNNVTFGNINNTTSISKNGAYQDFSCTSATIVDALQTYQLTISVKSFASSAQRYEAYIDYNNNGIFEYPNELVASGTGVINQNKSYIHDVTIPDTAVKGKIIRLRVMADVSAFNDNKRNCSQILDLGDVEDYGVYINEIPTPPTVCPPGNVTLYTQAQINSFPIDYNNCKQINGYLTITGPSDITNLNGLSNLETITGQLNIVHNNNLTDLSGLSNLKTVGNNFWIADNAVLTTINSFNALQTTGQFFIGENISLNTITGFNALTSIVNLSFVNNPLLQSINGLNKITNIGGIVNIYNNTVLQNFNALSKLTSIGGALQFIGNNQVQNIDSLYKLTTVAGVVNIANNTALQHINGLRSLTTIGSHLQFLNNTQLQNIDSLHKLKTVAGIFNITNNGSLQHVNGLRSLTSIGGYFQIWNNAQLKNIDSLHKLTQINGQLYVGYNPQLQNVNGFGSLQTITGFCTFERNAQLQNLDSLYKLTQVGRYIYLDSNTALININGLRNTTFTTYNGYGLTIKDNHLLAVCNLPNFCTYLANPSNTHLREISGNLANCLNEATVVAACSAPINEYVNFLGTMFVKKGASGTGSSWNNAIGELADALVIAKKINDTSAGKVKEIWVASGTYKPMYSPEDGANFGTNKGRDNAFSLLNNVKLYGGFAGSESSFSQRILDTANPTILSGDIDNNNILDNGNTYHVVVAAGLSSSTVLDGFTIKLGNANSIGALVVNGNSVEKRVGGGIVNYSSSPIIRNCIITQNRTDYDGGGLVNYYSSSPTITQCFFTGNVASYGGAIENYNNSNPIIINSVFTGNNATYGSGIESYQNSIPVLTNCTFSGNNANLNGVIYFYGTSTEPIITNTIIYGNSSGLNYVPTKIINNSLIQGLAGGSNGNINGNSDPLFVNAPSYILAPFTKGDYRLQIGSPAINAGTSDTTGFKIGNRDVVGIARIVGGTIDMGAYESYKKFFYTTGSNAGYVLSNWKSNLDGTGSSPSAFKEPADFTIQSGHTITLNNGMDLNVGNNDVIVQPNAIIDGNMPLITGGTLTNNGTISTLAILFGNLHQTIKGNGTITNLGLNNSAGATIETNSTVNITDTYTPVLGTLTTNNGLFLLSNENGTARIAQGTDNYINGNVTIERYIPAKAARKWSFITSPVSGTIHNTWQQQIHITGTGTGGTVCPTFTPHSNGFDATVSSAPNIYTYDASQISGSRWQVPTSTLSENIAAGKGFRVNIRGDRSLGCNLLDGSPSGLVPTAVTLRATGTLSNAAKNMGSFSITYPNAGINNYVFVGNPYPSAISFSALQTTNNSSINNTYVLYVPSSPSGVYSYWDGSSFTGGSGYDNSMGNTLASGQAFFVRSKVAGNLTMLFEESYKTDGANTGYFRTNNYNEKLRVHYLQNDHSQMDEIVIRYVNDATINNVEESSLDIASINSGSNYITSLKGNKGMAVQTRNLQTLTTDTVWLNVVSTQSATYKLNFSEFENFATADIYLIDHFTNTIQNVKQNTMYEFSVDKDNAATKGTQRFSVVFSKKQLPELTLNRNIKLYPNPANKQVSIQLPQSTDISYNIKVTDMAGKIVLQQKATSSTEQLNISKLSKGTYIVEIIDSKGSRTTEKLVKN